MKNNQSFKTLQCPLRFRDLFLFDLISIYSQLDCEILSFFSDKRTLVTHCPICKTNKNYLFSLFIFRFIIVKTSLCVFYFVVIYDNVCNKKKHGHCKINAMQTIVYSSCIQSGLKEQVTSTCLRIRIKAAFRERTEIEKS